MLRISKLCRYKNVTVATDDRKCERNQNLLRNSEVDVQKQSKVLIYRKLV